MPQSGHESGGTEQVRGSFGGLGDYADQSMEFGQRSCHQGGNDACETVMAL
jgi:hypothetical protein